MIKILVIDDDAVVRDVIRAWGDTGARVAERAIGKREPFDLETRLGRLGGEYLHGRLFEPCHAGNAHQSLEKGEGPLGVSVYRSLQLPHASSR